MTATPVDIVTQLENNLLQPAKRAFVQIQKQWNTWGRTFSTFADDALPAPWNDVAKKIFHSLPIAAAVFTCPIWLHVSLGLGLLVYHNYEPFSEQTCDMLLSGAFIGTSLRTAYNFISLMTTPHPGYLTATIGYGIASSLLFPQAKIYPK